MTDEKLVFGGINGVTGEYGLPPTTSEELAAHIAGRMVVGSSQRQKVESQLGRDNANKIASIVRLLAESNLENRARDADWLDGWLEKLARTVAIELLGKEYTEPEQIDALKKRLSRPAVGKVDKVEEIVDLLVRGQVKELTEMLLEDQDLAPDNSQVLKEQLKRDAIDRIGDVQRNLLSASRAGALGGNDRAQSAWLEALIRSLRLVPIEALHAISTRRVRPLKPLIEQLDALASKRPSPWLDGWRQQLAEESKTISWPEMIDVLQQGLRARIAAGDDAVSWVELLDALRKWLDVLPGEVKVLAVIARVDPTDLGQAGWGIIFPYEDPQAEPKVPEIKRALQPLLDLRQTQAGPYFKMYEGADGYRPNDTASKFVTRHGARLSDPADPDKVPYYLLIVGSPEKIPFHFQYQLDVQYAVGRIDLGDDLEAYANYARNVVAAESGGLARPLRASFFGVSNPNDRATQLSADYLVEPLYERIQARYGERWQVEAVLREEATKARLMKLVGGEGTPSLLFAASHGMEYPKDDAQGRQEQYQGALLCQDWGGPEGARGEVSRDYYLAGEDLARDADLRGIIAFFFACYGAGTPRFDEYTKQDFIERQVTIAERPFVAALPKAMLGLGRGALAVVGHVERAWGTSFLGARQSVQIAVFESAMERLLEGQPLGAAMEYFDGRYAALSTELAAELENAQWREPDPYELAEIWTANNDARGYIVLGDPAVRLPVAQEVETTG